MFKACLLVVTLWPNTMVEEHRKEARRILKRMREINDELARWTEIEELDLLDIHLERCILSSQCRD